MLMGFNSIVLVAFFIIVSVYASHDAKTLDAYIQEYAQNTMVRPRTGTLYNISLPSNFSGMQVSVVRYRSRSFWARGSNISLLFDIPTRILTRPFVTRFDLVFQNLGNWSSLYYNLPNHTLVTPVVGFLAYSLTNSTSPYSRMLNLSVDGDPIKVRFPNVWQMSDEQKQNQSKRCVRFGQDGSVEYGDLITRTGECIVRDQGHFAIVIPTSWNEKRMKKKEIIWKWWVVGFGLGVVGLVMVILIGMLIIKVVNKKRMGKMERESEKSEVLDTIWVGSSKMPSATVIRTQPVLENEYRP